jgi:hypothetical protein
MILWTCSKGGDAMTVAQIFIATIVGGTGVACAAWPLRAVTFCRWFHRRKPQWVQDLPGADLVMRPWMPTYFRIMGIVFCLFSVVLIWIAASR